MVDYFIRTNIKFPFCKLKLTISYYVISIAPYELYETLSLQTNEIILCTILIIYRNAFQPVVGGRRCAKNKKKV